MVKNFPKIFRQPFRRGATIGTSLTIITFCVGALFTSSVPAQVMIPDDRAGLISTPQGQQNISFRLLNGQAASRNLPYQITDYVGAVVGRGVATNGDGKLGVTINLPTGYYEVRFGKLNSVFGVFVAPKTTTESDFYGVDAGMSWFAPIPARPSLLEDIDHLGLGSVRERLRWGLVNPGAGKWDWSTYLQYESMLKSYGVKRVIEVAHDAPDWMPKARGGHYPADLVATDHSWQAIASRWHPYWAGLEAWNEPNNGSRFSGDQPPDQYVPYIRALRHALNLSATDTPLGGGVFAGFDENFVDFSAMNGMIDEVDFVSFHYYADPLGLEGRITQFRKWLARYGRESKPLWITEAGVSWPLKAAPTKVLLPSQMSKQVLGALARPSSKEGASIALGYAMLAEEARACGVARFVSFSLLPITEGGKQFGMLDGNGTPMPSLAAYATTVRMLNDAKYVGDVRLDGTRRARAFRVSSDDDSLLVVAYTGVVDPQANLRLPFLAQAAFGIDGRSLAVSESNVVSTADGLVYLKVEKSKLAGLLDTDTQAAKLSRIASQPAPGKAPASDVILQAIVPESTASANIHGYQTKPGLDRFPMQIRVTNLSAGSNYHVQLLAGTGSSVTVDVPPRGSKIVNMEPPLSNFQENSGRVKYIKITASSNQQAPIAPLVLAIASDSHLESVINHVSDRIKSVINNVIN